MKRMYNLIATALLLVFFTSAQAQESWSLQKCIDYALKNNIQIKQQAQNSAYYNNQLGQAKYNRLPNLNAGIQNNMSFGRSLGSDNTYLDINSNSTSGSLNSNITVWNGFTLANAIKAAEMDLRASLEEMQKAKDDITLNIAASYLEILFAE